MNLLLISGRRDEIIIKKHDQSIYCQTMWNRILSDPSVELDNDELNTHHHGRRGASLQFQNVNQYEINKIVPEGSEKVSRGPTYRQNRHKDSRPAQRLREGLLDTPS